LRIGERYMAFQDNSGDIILDVVLTDEGRRRLAQGGGAFSIAKFALGDDEVNYGLFDKTATTALQDITILQTPILEAFTNNTSLMKSKLVSLANQNLLYMPILKLNTLTTQGPSSDLTTDGNFVVCVNEATFDNSDAGANSNSIGIGTDDKAKPGFLYGLDDGTRGGSIVVDSGIHSTNVTEIDPSLIETEFIIEMDNRLGQLMSIDGSTMPTPFVDDDYVATYTVTKPAGQESPFITLPTQTKLENKSSPIDGPVSSRISFKIRSSQDLRVSNFLFDRIGSTVSNKYLKSDGATYQDTKIIDSIIRVTGRTTGYAIDIPVRFAKV
jgi:hypothetical protein